MTDGKTLGNPMPQGTVTFLFTDIEGSTELWQRNSEAMAAALAHHDATVRSTLEGRGGYIFGLGGDGFFAAFESPRLAIAAGREVQAALVDEELINVRVGIHTGDAARRDGAFFGMEVNRTARIASAAHGGQIVMSAVTAALCAGEEVSDLGDYSLKGLEGEIGIWQVGINAFPPLRVDRVEGNIDVPPNSFIGREAELTNLRSLLTEARLITLAGMGGVGKTRLATHLASEVAHVFRNGVWMVSLASVADPAVVPTAIADAVGLRVSPNVSVEEAVERWFERSSVLLVLDNCEHVADAVADLLERLIVCAGSSRIVATSQVPTAVVGEHLVPVEPLVGDHGAAGVALFIERARAVRPDFEASAAELDIVHGICARLDHLPLAIELAASRLRSMTVEEVDARLDERLRLLAGGNRRAPDRHKTLAAAVGWSYSLLEEETKTVLRRASVFLGPFDLDLAEAVLTDESIDEWQLLDLLAELVERSLVVASSEAGATNYHLLESVKAFGRSELEATGEMAEVVRKYTDHLHAVVLVAGPQLLTSQDQQVLQRVHRYWPHVRGALGVTAEDIESTRFEEMYAALGVVWNEHGRTSEGVQWAQVLLARPLIDPAARVGALNPAGGVCNVKVAGAGAAFDDEAIDLWREHDTDPPLCALANRALDALLNGEDDAALGMCREVIELADQHDAPSWNREHAMPVVLSLLGQLDTDLVFLRSIWEREMRRAEQMGCSWHSLTLRASMSRNVEALDLGDPKAFIEDVVEELLAMGNPHSASHHMSALGIFELRSGDTRAGLEHQAMALELALEHAPGYVAQRCVVVAALVAGSHPEAGAQLLGFIRAKRAARGYAGSTGELQVEAFGEPAIRQSLGEEFDVLERQGRLLSEEEAAALARRCLLEVKAAALSD